MVGRAGARYHGRMSQLPPYALPGRVDTSEQAHSLLVAVDRYAATFDLMLIAWRDRSIYETVREDLDALAASQKSQAPEAGLAMLELAMAHNDVAAALTQRLLALEASGAHDAPDGVLEQRQQRHTEAITELRSYVLRKIH